MSAKLSGQVWELDLPHGEQLVMLALADHGEDDGSQIFPSVDRIAWKTGYKARQVQNILRALEAKGLIEKTAYQHGGRGHATEYKMNIEKGAKKTPFIKKGANIAPEERVQSSTQKGAISDVKGAKSSTKGAIAIAPQPSYNHQETSRETSVAAHAAPPPPPPEPVEDIPPTPKTLTPQQALVKAFADVMQVNASLTGGKIAGLIGALRKSGPEPTPELVEAKYGPGGWHYGYDWRGRKNDPPNFASIRESWGVWPENVAPLTNGNGRNHSPPSVDANGQPVPAMWDTIRKAREKRGVT